ncbi:ABC transporter ATP-binding protein [Gordonia neofelifaecis]|uniref:ABC transporter related protein n=1 Tax=Gordonia neofelifaecis NRRL B-59395 TaxID=644548 RepID=F1YLW6_9ACTN|nr:ABC transporter ATP-binding protein [Gordonia neofelifaecis]EGD54217.1 ABC transporter related protein [Gordonia neofelifaecis NRRL B-59395]
MTTSKVIDVRGLQKRFGSFAALDGLDLSVAAGEVAGFLGPNGAGKSTTIRILLGMLRQDGGQAAVFGADPHRDAVAIHRRLAYVPGDVTLWPQLTGGECIDLLLRLRGIDPDRTPARATLIDRFELDPTKKSKSYSKGNRQKVALVAAFAADTDLLVLDEPTSGLDPLMTREFTRCVAERAERGAAVLMSSHLLAEVEALCSSVTIIRAGRTVQTGRLEDLRHLRRSRVTAELARAAALESLPGVHDLETTADGEITFTVDDEALSAVTAELSKAGVTRLSIEPPSLEELFLQNYSDQDQVGA